MNNARRATAPRPVATDDTTSITFIAPNAAAEAVTSAGGTSVVLLPAGTYMTATTISVPTGVILRGSGMAMTTVKSTAGAGSANVISVLGNNDCGLEDLTVDANNRTTSIGVYFAAAGGTGSRTGIRRCRIVNAANNAVRAGSASIIRGFEVSDCVIDTCVNGISVYSQTGQTQRDVRILNNTIINTGTNNIQTIGANAHEFTGVQVIGNRLHNFQNVGANGRS
jgi:hypothetical protein